MFWKIRLSYSYTIPHCIDIKKIAIMPDQITDLHDTMETREIVQNY